MLLAAERPLLLLGGGVIGAQATDEVRALAEQLQIPVSVTLMGKGGFPEIIHSMQGWLASRHRPATATSCSWSPIGALSGSALCRTTYRRSAGVSGEA